MENKSNNPFFDDSTIDNTTINNDNNTSQPIQSDNINNNETTTNNDQTTSTESDQASSQKSEENKIINNSNNNNINNATNINNTPNTNNINIINTPSKVEGCMVLSRLGCILNNYNILISLLIPTLFLFEFFYIIGMTINLIIVFVISCITLGLIYTRYSLSDMLIVSKDNMDQILSVCYNYVLPISIATHVISCIISLISMIITNKNISKFRLVSSIVTLIISIIFVILYFYMKSNGGFEL